MESNKEGRRETISRWLDYGKQKTENRWRITENRKQKTENRKPKTENR